MPSLIRRLSTFSPSPKKPPTTEPSDSASTPSTSSGDRDPPAAHEPGMSASPASNRTFTPATVPLMKKKTFTKRVTVTLEALFIPRKPSSRQLKGGRSELRLEHERERWSIVSRSPSPPSPDIRCPSGLGHRASLHDESASDLPASPTFASSPFPTSRRPSTKSATRLPFPAKILPLILEACSREDLPSFACVSRSFRDAARPFLYGDIHFDDIDADMRSACLETLATRSDIAKHVLAFSWNALVPTLDHETHTVSLLPQALQNMHALRVLSLSHKDPRLLTNVTARLADFTSRGLSTLEAGTFLASWLPTQPALTALALPDIFCLPLSPRVLPALARFAGTASLAAALIPSRPVRDVAVQICTSIYDGLRPSELMGSLAQSAAPVETLRLSMTGKIDARTHERVLMAAAARLPQLKELYVSWLLEPEELYTQITSVLPRLSALEALVLCVDENSHLDFPPPDPTKEDAAAASWHRQCPSLRQIEFLSGALWLAPAEES